MTITPLSPVYPVINSGGQMSQQMRSWAQAVTQLQIVSGIGSPEGVVKASPKQVYMDESGTSGSILYIKRDDNIGGDTSQGWILI